MVQRIRSFVVKMVDSNDVDQAEETVVIDIDKTVDRTVPSSSYGDGCLHGSVYMLGSFVIGAS